MQQIKQCTIHSSFWRLMTSFSLIITQLSPLIQDHSEIDCLSLVIVSFILVKQINSQTGKKDMII